MYELNNKTYQCSLEAVFDMLGGKWRSLILWHLLQETLRFSQIQTFVPGISKKVLSEHLRVLEQYALISRTVYLEVPPRVEYRITEKGKTLETALNALETDSFKVFCCRKLKNSNVTLCIFSMPLARYQTRLKGIINMNADRSASLWHS
ncbi:helix-turn-helix domain-containing protein [Candidatus Albibeggiatoa sp. nov. BB20]|uniref:winged helix-turn-helix transcriptional regulator n=1 Tax=Candidatus Albibeggiatoa sp. nov. BB20 TaxID=3162723 RepID=UPI0033658577